MDGGACAGFVSIGVLMVGNMVVVAYSYGKVKQRVEDLCGRVTRLEDAYNNRTKRKK